MKKILLILILFAFLGCKSSTKTLYITNHSSDPYQVFVNEQLQAVLPAGTSHTMEVQIGSSYQLKAKQASGYLIYLTVYEYTLRVADSDMPGVSWTFPD